MLRIRSPLSTRVAPEAHPPARRSSGAGRALVAGALVLLVFAAPARAQEEPAEPPPAEDDTPAATPLAPDEPELEEELAAGAGDEARYGLQARVRYVTVPTWLTNLFLDHSTPMRSVGFAAGFVRRRGDLDVVVSLEYESTEAEEGLYLEKGDDPSTADGSPDYVTFDGFGFLGVDVSALWHVKLHERVHLRYGAGLGLGVPLGDIIQTETMCPPGTTADDLGDPNHCTRLAGMESESDVPPVLPILNLLVGVRIPVVDELAIHVEGGFRNMLFFGIATDYMF